MEKELAKLDELKQTLTGIRKKDRLMLFQYILLIDSNIEPTLYQETIKYGFSYIPNNIEELTEEAEKAPEIYIPALIHLGRARELNIYKRVSIFTFLASIIKKRELLIRENKEALVFNLDDRFQEKLINKFINGPKVEFVSDEWITDVYYYAGLTMLEYGDQQLAFQMFIKANEWNPVSPHTIEQMLDIFKTVKQSDDLLKMGAWLNRISYKSYDIAFAFRALGYGYYLQGKNEMAYACYYQAISYNSEIIPGLNEEIVSILRAMGKDEPYTLTKKEIKALFLGMPFQPFPSEEVFEQLRQFIIKLYVEEAYIEILEIAPHYLLKNPHDEKIMAILNKSQIALN